MKIKLYLFFVFIAFSVLSQEKLKGIYDHSSKRFLEHNTAFGFDTLVSYTVFAYINDQAVVEKQTKPKSFSFRNDKSYGIIDTSGNILVPFNYIDYEPIHPERTDIILFSTDSSRQIYLLGKGFVSTTKEQRLPKNARINLWHLDHHYILFSKNDAYGLIHLDSQKIILDAIADNNYISFPDLEITNFPIKNPSSNLFYIHHNNGFYVYNFKTGYQSEQYRSVRDIGSDVFEVIRTTNEIIYTKDLVHLTPLFHFPIVDAFNSSFIVEKKQKYGLVNVDGDTILPIIYDDLVFVNYNYIAIKKGNTWAFASYDGQIISEFLFYSMDQTNEKVYKDIQYLTHLDTTKFDVNQLDYHLPHNNNSIEFVKIIRGLNYLKHNKRLYPTLFSDNRTVFIPVQLLDKQVLIHKLTNDFKDELYDEVFYIPTYHHVIVYRIGKKYGDLPKMIKYQGVFYDVDDQFFCSGSRYYMIKSQQIYCSKKTYNKLTDSWQYVLDFQGKVKDVHLNIHDR